MEHVIKSINLGTPPAILSSVKTTIKLSLAALLALGISAINARSDDGTDGSKTQPANAENQSANSDSKSQSANSDSKSQEGESGSKVVVDAPKVSTVQSAARPFNLDIAGPVYLAGSDSRSAAFQANELPAMMNTVNQNLSEFKPLTDISVSYTHLTLPTKRIV